MTGDVCLYTNGEYSVRDLTTYHYITPSYNVQCVCIDSLIMLYRGVIVVASAVVAISIVVVVVVVEVVVITSITVTLFIIAQSYSYSEG